MILTRGCNQLRLIWNHPTWALSYGRWTYRPEDDERLWFARVRVGPLKIEAVRCCQERSR